MATWQGNLKGGWRVENVRPLDGDPVMKWEGEVTFDEDDIQTWQWTAEGLYYAWGMKSPYDLKPASEITRQLLDAGKIVHIGWNPSRDTAEQCGVNVLDYFDACGKFLGADENGLVPIFEPVAAQ